MTCHRKEVVSLSEFEFEHRSQEGQHMCLDKSQALDREQILIGQEEVLAL